MEDNDKDRDDTPEIEDAAASVESSESWLKRHRLPVAVAGVAVAAALVAGIVAGVRAHDAHVLAVAEQDCVAAVRTMRKAEASYDSLVAGDAKAASTTTANQVKDAKTIDTLKTMLKAATPKTVACKADGRKEYDTLTGKAKRNTAWYKTHRQELDKAVKAVNQSKLDKTVADADALYKATDGKVADNKTREALAKAVKSRDAQAIGKAVKAVNDSKSAKDKADAEAAAKAQAEQEAAAAAAAQQQAAQTRQSYTPSYSNGSGSYSNGGGYSGGSYSAPKQSTGGTQQQQSSSSMQQQLHQATLDALKDGHPCVGQQCCVFGACQP